MYLNSCYFHHKTWDNIKGNYAVSIWIWWYNLPRRHICPQSWMGIMEVNFDIDICLAPRTPISFSSFHPKMKVQKKFYLKLKGHGFVWASRLLGCQLCQSDYICTFYLIISKHEDWTLLPNQTKESIFLAL